MQNCEPTNRNCIKGRTLWGESAKDDKTMWLKRHGRCSGCAVKVHALIRGGLCPELMIWLLIGDIPGFGVTGDHDFRHFQRVSAWKVSEEQETDKWAPFSAS